MHRRGEGPHPLMSVRRPSPAATTASVTPTAGCQLTFRPCGMRIAATNDRKASQGNEPDWLLSRRADTSKIDLREFLFRSAMLEHHLHP